MVFAGDDFADEDLVVAAGKDLDDPTIDECQAARQDRCRRAGRGGVQTGEVLRPRRCKPSGDFFLVHAKDVDCEAPVLREVVERMGSLSTATSTRGGSSESEAIALAVRPCGPALPSVVTTVTPVANWPMICRCFLESKVIQCIASLVEIIDRSPRESGARRRGQPL